MPCFSQMSHKLFRRVSSSRDGRPSTATYRDAQPLTHKPGDSVRNEAKFAQ